MEPDQEDTTAAHDAPVHERYPSAGLPVVPKDEPPPAPPAGTRPAFFAPEPTRNLVPEANITHTGEMVREWVRAALVQAGAGEPFHYDVSLVLVPNRTEFAMRTAYAIVVYTSNPIMNGTPLGTVEHVTDFPTEREIKNVVRKMVVDLHDLQASTLGEALRLH